MGYRFFFCLLFLILALTSISLPGFAAPQSIKCHFTDVTNPDQLVINFSSEQAASLVYLVSNLGINTSDNTDASLPLKRKSANDHGNVEFSTDNAVMQMTFKMPAALLGKQNAQFQATLSSQIEVLRSNQDQDLSCESSPYAHAQ